MTTKKQDHIYPIRSGHRPTTACPAPGCKPKVEFARRGYAGQEFWIHTGIAQTVDEVVAREAGRELRVAPGSPGRSNAQKNRQEALGNRPGGKAKVGWGNKSGGGKGGK